jgi:hypothetical protein
LSDGEDPLCFRFHIFSLGVIFEEDDLGNLTRPEDNEYMLLAYIKRQELLPEFISFKIPTDKIALSLYHSQVFAMKYQFYLHIQKTIGQELAVRFTQLSDPLMFSKAKAAYELVRGGWGIGN